MSATSRNYRQGDVLFREGDASTGMFLIKRGTVEIRKAKGSGHVVIARVYANEVIGELSFFDRQPRSATAVASSAVEAVEIPFAALEAMYKQVPDYLKAILGAVAERLRKSNETIRRLQKQMDSSDEKPKDEPTALESVLTNSEPEPKKETS